MSKRNQQVTVQLHRPVSLQVWHFHSKKKQFTTFSCWIYERFISGEQSASSNDDTEIVCENGVCFKRPKQKTTENEPTEDAPSSSNNTQQLTNEEKLERAKSLLEKKRKEKEEEDARVSY